MKKLLCLLSVLLLLAGMVSGTTVAAAGTASISVSKSEVTVGNTVTITAKYDGGGVGIGSMEANLTYDTKCFEYVSCDGATASGGAGKVKMSYYATEAVAPKTVTVTLTFKAVGAGSSSFKWVTEGMYDDDDNSLGSPSKTMTVAASNPQLSGDATLKTLYPTKGTLTPKFDKNVTEYTVSVPYTVTRGLLVFDPTDPNAKSVVTENADLKVGKTTRVITVTAPNGTTKKYTVVFIREEQQATTSGTGTDATTTTTAPITNPEVEVDGEMLSVAVNQPPLNPPTGFVWDYVTLGDGEVAAAKMESGKLVLLYLTAKDAESGSFYLYDAATDAFSPFRQLTEESSNYILHDLPESEVQPVGTVIGSCTIGEQTVSAYVYEDPTLADFAVLYLTTIKGETGLYTYDKRDGSFQRYHEVIVEKEVAVTPEPEAEKKGFLSFIEDYRQIILVVIGGLVVLTILVIVIILIANNAGKRKGKH